MWAYTSRWGFHAPLQGLHGAGNCRKLPYSTCEGFLYGYQHGDSILTVFPH